MSKSQRKNNYYDDFEKTHHQAKQYKKVKEKKSYKKLESVLRSKDVNKLLNIEENY
jgi:hypothetical protein